LERKAEVDFLADLVAEDADAAAHFSGREQELARPEEAELKPEHLFYWAAFQRLRYDRFIGAMGGEGPIYYQAVSRYAQDYQIRGIEFEILQRLIGEMDIEYLAVQAEKAKEDERKRKQHDGH
jgi:hypothetical protein